MPYKHTVLIDDDNEERVLDSEFENVNKGNYSRKVNIILRSYFSRNAPDYTITAKGKEQLAHFPGLGVIEIEPDVGIPASLTITPGPAHKEASIVAKKDHCEKTFEQFWEAYPNKKGKAAAKRKWMKIKPDEALLTKIAHNLKTRKDWDDPTYIPKGSTYVNQELWDDQDAEEVVDYVDTEEFSQSLRDEFGDG